MAYQIAVRISDPIYKRLKKVTDRKQNWQAPTITAMVQRGLELAIKELEQRRKTERTK